MKKSDYIISWWERDTGGTQHQFCVLVQGVREAEAVTHANACRGRGGMAVSVYEVAKAIKLAN